jgi:hypothetical protein
MSFIDNDDVPIAFIGPDAEFGILFKSIDRNDGFIEIMEWVCVGWDLAANAFKSDRIEANQWNGEPGPELLLKLRHHALGCDHQNSLTLAAIDQLAEKNSDLDGFAEPDRSHKDALARLFESKQCRARAGREVVDSRPMPNPQILAGWRRLRNRLSR